MDFILQNHEFIIGLATTLILWIASTVFKKNLNSTTVTAVLGKILDIIQDIKTAPATATLDDYTKKQRALQRVAQELTPKETSLVHKVFGTIGGAIEFVFHNKKTLYALGRIARAII
jgi:hypothetical protein